MTTDRPPSAMQQQQQQEFAQVHQSSQSSSQSSQISSVKIDMPPIITSAPPPYYDFPPAYSANPTDIVNEAPPRYTARRDRAHRIHRDQLPSITERHLTAIETIQRLFEPLIVSWSDFDLFWRWVPEKSSNYGQQF
ncbi:hypothetical protein WR25_14490 [Diploscapter pachys]|uniref:Uncharacterized protein n=1 Tax=Diploscapter pachys TaxID=2018661 RepID=A0A2A2J258_9BILA|nr:hypothetical protein WR25_14490 [Diploscapter pachys]